jgi:hypothetical protein
VIIVVIISYSSSASSPLSFIFIYRYRYIFLSVSFILHVSCIMPIRMGERQQKQSTHYAHRSRFPSSFSYLTITHNNVRHACVCYRCPSSYCHFLSIYYSYEPHIYFYIYISFIEMIILCVRACEFKYDENLVRRRG